MSRHTTTGQHADNVGQNIESSPSTRLLTAEEVAQRWQVEKAHVYRLAREGRVPCVTLGRYRRFRLDALENFERAGGSTAE